MNRVNWRERGISFLASVLFHVAILFLLVKMVPPVRVYLFRHAADVRIVEQPLILFPQIEGFSEEVQTSEVPIAQIPSEDSSVSVAAAQQQREPEPGVVYLKNLIVGRIVEQTTETFNLVPNPKPEATFSLGINRKKPEPEAAMEDTREDLDFAGYNARSLSVLPFNRIITKKGGGVSSGQIESEMSRQLEEYDITPWVKQVVDKIRNNWKLPPIDASIAIGEVKILVIIGKQGNIVAMEIVESSQFQVFDRTTTAAIRSSAPFPPLPADFPLEKLEAFLVFEFHE